MSPDPRTIELRVIGIPVAQGSLKAFTPKGWKRPVLTSTAKGLKAWRALIASAAQSQLNANTPPWRGPVVVRVQFYLPRPKGHSGKRGLLPSAPLHPVSRPDLDKCLRASLDALTDIVWADDSQVVQVTVAKAYADACPPGMRATIELHEQENAREVA